MRHVFSIPCGVSVFGRTTPRPATPPVSREENARKTFSPLHGAIRACEAGLAGPASSPRFCTPIPSGRINEISPEPPHPLAPARACVGPPSEFSTCFSDAPVDHSHEGLAVAPGVDPSLELSEHGPKLVSYYSLDYTSLRPTSGLAVHYRVDMPQPDLL